MFCWLQWRSRMEAWAESSSSSPSWSPSWGWACWRWWERSFMDAGSRTDASDSTEEDCRAVPVAAVAAPNVATKPPDDGRTKPREEKEPRSKRSCDYLSLNVVIHLTVERSTADLTGKRVRIFHRRCLTAPFSLPAFYVQLPFAATGGC